MKSDYVTELPSLIYHIYTAFINGTRSRDQSLNSDLKGKFLRVSLISECKVTTACAFNDDSYNNVHSTMVT